MYACSPSSPEEADPGDRLFDRNTEYLRLEEDAGFTGVVAIHYNGQPQFLYTAGYANKEREIRNSGTTVFDIGSLTKQFTAAAVLKLCEMKKLDLLDPIGKFFSDVTEGRQNITIHQLLTHTSGLPRSFESGVANLDAEQLHDRFNEIRLVNDPGQTFVFSEIGYNLLGRIVEQASGMTYESFLQQYLFAPLEMTSTGYVLPNWNMDQVASGYFGCQNFGKPMDIPWSAEGPYWEVKAADGLLSCATDLMKWYEAIMNNSVLDSTITQKMLSRHVKEGRNSHYGYGWSIVQSNRKTWVFKHDGGNGLFFADWVNYPQEDVSILLLSNEGRRGNHLMVYELATILFYPDHEGVLKGRPSQCMDSLPDNRLGQIADEFIRMLASGRTEDVNDFYTQYVGTHLINKHPEGRIKSVFGRIQEDAGPTRIKQVLMIDHRILHIELIRISDHQVLRLRLSFDPNEDYKVMAVSYDSPDS